jgi:hypothetical protein
MQQPQQHRASLSGLLLLAAPVKRRRVCAAAVAVATLIPLACIFSAAALLWNRQAGQQGFTPHAGRHTSTPVLLALPHDTRCSSSSVQQQQQHPRAPLVAPRSSGELGALLQAQGLTTGAELGMHVGRFASELLDAWPSAGRYYMVYASGQQQPTSKPTPNNPQHLQQHKVLGMAGAALQQHARRVVWLHEWTSAASADAAALIQEPLEFVFVNAQLDVCGVLADVRAWWQHLAPGGIMAGQDLLRHAVLALQQRASKQQERVLVCADGTSIDSPAAAQAQLATFFKQQPGVQLVHAVLDSRSSSSSSSSSGNGTATIKQSIWLVRKPGVACSSSSSSSGEKLRPEGRHPPVHADPLAHLLSHMQQPEQQPGQQQPSPTQQPQEQQPSPMQQQLRRLHKLAEQRLARVHV